MTTKYDRFVEALDALCKEHDVLLSPGGYDILGVWDGSSVYASTRAGVTERIEDRTKTQEDGK